MIIGIPKEIKQNECRVAIIPAGIEALIARGHKVFIEKNSGINSGFSDQDYLESGAKILETPKEIFDVAELILKIKEPLPPEYSLIRENQLIFTFLHLASDQALTETLLNKKALGIAYETVQLKDGSLPLLAPMSEIAGKMAPQIGANLLENHYGGRGILLGGAVGTLPGKVVVIGAGTVGLNATKIALGFGADVTIIDINLHKLSYISDIFQGRVKTLMSNTYNIKQAVQSADLLIGAVLIPGAKAPHLVTKDMIRAMKPGSVVVDVAIDQGGSIETIDRITTHENPTYEKYGVIHYSVANIPGAVPRTSTFAITNATLPYILELADKGISAIKDNKPLAKGVNTINGKLTYKAVAEAFGLEYTPLDEAIKLI